MPLLPVPASLRLRFHPALLDGCVSSFPPGILLIGGELLPAPQVEAVTGPPAFRAGERLVGELPGLLRVHVA
jgi:hypothetical protein